MLQAVSDLQTARKAQIGEDSEHSGEEAIHRPINHGVPADMKKKTK
jgi:hypothetical protein